LTVSRKREDVQARHQEIQRLRRKPRYSLPAIARAVGLADHSTVLYHLNGSCRCLMDRTFPLAKDEKHHHVWKCECGARG
jgi:hypothetical protein